MKRWIPLAILAACGVLLSARLWSSSASHDDVFTSAGLLTANAEDLKATAVTGHLEVPIETGRSVLWCGTFQLVWNEICGLIGEDIHFERDPPMVAPMNKKAFPREHIDDASYLALAGFVRDGIFEKIPRALKEKFGGKATPRFLPDRSLTPRPQDIVGYAYLFKHLVFATPLERLEEPLDFQGAPVSAFGLGPFKAAQVAMLAQVTILRYDGPDNFILELKSKSAGDQLVLAKVRPEATLGETVAAVCRDVAAATPQKALPGDVLSVPRLNFDITRTYREIMGGLLVTHNPAVAKDLVLLSAVQNIRFEMDEKGVRLRSESHMSFGCSAKGPPEPHHVMIFDKSFLILLRRTDAPLPYFALWIGSPELLVGFKK